MRRPVIIISPCRSGSDYYGELYRSSIVSIDYNTTYMTEFGALPLVPDMVRDEETAEEIMSLADGLFVTGGSDLNPSLYGEELLECCGSFDDERDLSDTLLIKAAMKLNKPILAICRGCQIGNVYFGGSLYQDINTFIPDHLTHRYYGERPHGHEGEYAHELKLVEGSPLAKLLGKDTAWTNSLHHQALNKLGDGVKPMAYSGDGLVEAWYYDDDRYYVRGYRWHPEMYRPHTEQSSRIAEEFLDECRKRMK